MRGPWRHLAVVAVPVSLACYRYGVSDNTKKHLGDEGDVATDERIRTKMIIVFDNASSIRPSNFKTGVQG